MRKLIAALAVITWILLGGCFPLCLEPISPQSEIEYFTITVNSNPPGVHLYHANCYNDTLGQPIGTTPCQIRVGISRALLPNGDYDPRPRYWRIYSTCVQGGAVGDQGSLSLSAVAVKYGYTTRKINLYAGSYGPLMEYPPPDTTVTVELRRPVETDNQFVTVFIADTGAEYHTYGCKHLKTCEAISLKDAKSRGYSACSWCGAPK